MDNARPAVDFVGRVWALVVNKLRRPHRRARSFQQAVQDAGGVRSAVDRGMATVPTDRIVGSVSRWQNLRSDFFYRKGQAITQRFYRIGQAMAAGKALPPLELYKLKPETGGASQASRPSEYYVVDGHHRVAMARRLGQDFLDAHVTEYTVSNSPPPADAPAPSETQLAHALRRVPLFRDAPPENLVNLWRLLSEFRVSTGAVICKRGEPGDRFYIVQSGSVEVRLGTDSTGIALYRLYPGDCFGEMALLIGGVRSADVVAMEDTVLWALERADFERVVRDNLALLRALNRSLAQRLTMATGVIEQVESGGPRPGLSGVRFGPYHVIAQLGTGGMATVYSAVGEDGAVVALKVLPPSWSDAPQFRARLEREAGVLQRLQHPHIVKLVDVGVIAERLGGGTYIAMEWLPDALDRVLQARFPHPLGPRAAVRIATGVARALGAVHAADLIHRDIKPSNILLRENGEPVVTDFGLAANIGQAIVERRLTPADVLVGTADYLAPEQIAGQAIDGRADLYALGVVLFEMLSGFVPFAGRTPLQVLRAHAEEVVPDLPPSVPTVLRQVIERTLQKRPDNRFSSAAEMVEALEAAACEV